MSGKLVVGIDIGGTNLRGVLSDEKSNFLHRIEEKVDTKNNMALSNQIADTVKKLCDSEGIGTNRIKGIGIASTGPMRREEGVLINPSNLPFERIPITNPVEEKLDIPASLVNDCIAGVMGEKKFGIGRKRKAKNIVYVNIGTGIGGGAIVDGNVLFGHSGNAAEIGHLTIDPKMRLKCGCGKKGHWEAYCSGKNIPNFVKMKFDTADDERSRESVLFKRAKGDLSKITARDFFEAAKSGDELSRELLDEMGKMNAIGFSNVVDFFAPSVITIGGTVALKNKKEILRPIKNRINDHIRNPEPEITITQLGEDIGLYGGVTEALNL
ncbi:MAG: ROK family protein [Candidatus Hadarchaeia archaeon]